MATAQDSTALSSRQLSLPDCKTLPPSIPLITSSQDNWNSDSCQLETGKLDPNNHSLKLVDDAIQLLRSIDKPLAILSICGPYRSGKSYFISRTLGRPGAFKLGHSMQACTRGIWMATTVLECEDFATVLLDTEGIDAVGVSETMAMSLLTLTTLLSSFLIYNSKKVPQKVDLDKMRCFSQLSTSLLAQCGEKDVKKTFFPYFLWLLRDVSLKMTDREGKEVGPTEFLHSRVLALESGELTNLGKSLVSFFPSLECATLPIPSTKRNIIRGIVEQQDKLKPAFNAAVDNLIQEILQKVAPKKAVNGTTTVNGKALAALAEGYVRAVNKPGALPDLDQGWQAVVRLELKEYSYKLVREYEREMEEALEWYLPMEEEKLLSIHERTLKAKKSDLRKEIFHVNPLHSSNEEVQPLLDQLEHDIIQWSEPSSDREGKVSGGALYQFTFQNFSKSKEYCEKVITDILRKKKLHQKVIYALSNSISFDIENEVRDIEDQYRRKSVGPAASDVWKKELSQLHQCLEMLKNIPPQPHNVKVIGRGSDRVKLTWDPAAHDTKVPDVEYIVYKRIEGGEWEEAVRTVMTRALVKDLESGAKYEFQVVATNSQISSFLSGTETTTTYSVAGAAGTFSLLTMFAPSLAMEEFIRNEDSLKGSSTATKAARIALRLSIAPATILLAPLTAPLGAVVGVVLHSQGERGDLTE